MSDYLQPSIRKVGGWDPRARWRWEVIGSGQWGYCASRKAAAAEASACMERMLRILGERR